MSQPGERLLGCTRLELGKSVFRSKPVIVCITTTRVIITNNTKALLKALGQGFLAGVATRLLLGDNIIGRAVSMSVAKAVARKNLKPPSDEEVEMLKRLDREIIRGEALAVRLNELTRVKTRKPSLLKEGIIVLETSSGGEYKLFVTDKKTYEEAIELLNATGISIEQLEK